MQQNLIKFSGEAVLQLYAIDIFDRKKKLQKKDFLNY